MRIVETHDVIATGSFGGSAEWLRAWEDVQAAIRATDWPHGSGSFTIYPERKGNGVDPIKAPCINWLNAAGWQTEQLPVITAGVLGTGDLDALLQTSQGNVGFEWETGNISSSHRAVNKLLLSMMLGGLAGGFLVVPSNSLKLYLTDRIGNIGELRPYFRLWSSTAIRDGMLRIVVVEHDLASTDVPRIPKRTDGRALR